MALVNGKAIFDINTKGELSGGTFEGKFVLKLFPSLKDRQNIAVEFSKRNLGNDSDFDTEQMTKAVCELIVLTEESPEWFKNGSVWELVDLSPIVAIKEGLEAAQKEHMELLNK